MYTNIQVWWFMDPHVLSTSGGTRRATEPLKPLYLAWLIHFLDLKDTPTQSRASSCLRVIRRVRFGVPCSGGRIRRRMHQDGSRQESQIAEALSWTDPQYKDLIEAHDLPGTRYILLHCFRERVYIYIVSSFAWKAKDLATSGGSI